MSLRRYIFSLFLSFIVLFALMALDNNAYTLKENLISSSSKYFISLAVFMLALPKLENCRFLILLFFIIKVILGTLHYIIFVDPNYFSSDGSIFPYGVETDALYNLLETVVSNKQKFGIFFLDKNAFWATHVEIWNLIGILMTKTGLNALSIVPINSYFSSIFAYSMIVIAHYVYKCSKSTLNLVKWLFLLYPLFLQSDTFERDQIGISLMYISLTCFMLLKNKKSLWGGGMIVLVLICSMLLRTIYPILFAVSLLLYLSFSVKNKAASILLSIFVVAISIPFALTIINREESLEIYIENNAVFTSIGLLMIPVKVFVGLVGPFPWTQFFSYLINRIVAFQLGHYLLGALHISFVVIAIKSWRNNFRRANFGILELYGLLLLSAAFITSQMQITYVTVGILSLVILFAKNSNKSQFLHIYIFCFSGLLILSIIGSILGGFGISSIWR